jgi:hypothetical protein
MSRPQKPKPAKLVIGLFLKEKSIILLVAQALTEKFGCIDMVSEWFPFNFTDYYESEMGKPLFRRVLVFENLIEQGALAEIKLITNDIELEYSKNSKRMVNLDPGYLLRERFVLASGKNFSHRIYIGERIYADLTLIYTKGRFQTLPWTYPDYAEQNMMTYLEQVRKKYMADLKQTFKPGIS